jgi:ABC-2 type transport system permease protein
MNKYIALFKISIQQEFVYRLNFLMWRARNVISVLMIFFLWDSVFLGRNIQVLGYDRTKITTYILAMLILRSVVFSARAVDIGGEIARGDLSSYLIKPVKYFQWWFTRDLASKLLNLIFAFFETTIVFIILRPTILVQTNLIGIFLFIFSILTAVFINFLLLLIFGMLPFWSPEQAWGFTFLMMIFVDFMSGFMFPLDVLPSLLSKFFLFTPFPYLLYTPLQILLGKYDFGQSFGTVFIAFCWIVILTTIVKSMWKRGLKVYGAEGR